MAVYPAVIWQIIFPCMSPFPSVFLVLQPQKDVDITPHIYSFGYCHHHNSLPPWLGWTNQSLANDLQLPSVS